MKKLLVLVDLGR